MEATVSALLNQQINKEFYSAYLYLDIANFYASKGLDGFANWYQVQAKEEQDHAMLFYQYLHNNGQPVILEAVGKPDGAFASLEAPLAAALEHERYVTALINAIYTAAQAAQDYRTVQFLDWFVKEQGEEEKNAADLITKMELFGSDAKGLYMLNSELAARVYTHRPLCCNTTGTKWRPAPDAGEKRRLRTQGVRERLRFVFQKPEIRRFSCCFGCRGTAEVY